MNTQVPQTVGRVAFGPADVRHPFDLGGPDRHVVSVVDAPAPTPMDDAAKLEYWARRLDEASARVSDAKWARGDMLIEARRNLGDKWTQFLDLERIKAKEGVLRQELWISSKFPVAAREGRRRFTAVDWGQHRLVANDDISAADAMRLLRRSAAEGWSYSRMETAVRELRGQADAGGDMPDPTTTDRREYVERVVASRCPDVAPMDRRLVLSAAFAAQDEWERARGHQADGRATRVQRGGRA